MPIRDGGDVEFGVRITADNQVFVNGVRAATDETKKLGDALKGTGASADGAAKSHENLAGAVFKGVSAMEVLKRGLEEAVQLYGDMKEHTEAAQQAQARMEAVLHSTGGAAGQTADTIGQLADEMARLTKFDDTQIKDAASTLLTFDKIAGDTFSRVIKLSADLASTGRGDLQTWVTVLGKVGQDPVQSIGLLERGLGKLDPALKIAIQNASDFNDKAKAQALMLDEVERRVGGTAQESYRGLTRQIEGTKKAWDDLLRTVGQEIFSAKSREVSVFESAINHMTETFKSRVQAMKDVADSVPDFMLVMMGLPPRAMRDAAKAGAAQEAAMSPMERNLRAAIAAGKSYGGDTSMLENQLRGELARQSHVALQVDPWQSEPGFAPSMGQDTLTIRQQQMLHDQQLQLEQGFNDHMAQLRMADVQRALQIESQRHDMLLESDSTYFAKVAQLEQTGLAGRLDALRKDLSIEQQQLASAKAEVGRAKAAEQGGTGTSDAVMAADQRVAEIRAKIKSTTADIVDLEKQWGDAENKRAAAQYKADSDMIDRWKTIFRQRQDIQKTLDQQIGDLMQERDLVGKSEEEVRQANVQRALALKFDSDRLAIQRQIEDLQAKTSKDANDVQTIADLQEELDALPGMFKDAAEKSRAVVGEVFSRQRVTTMFSGIVSVMSDTFKSGWDAVVNHTGSAARAMRDTFKREFFDWLYAQFAKPFVLNVIAGVAGAGGIGATGLAQAATTAAGGNTIGSGFGSLAGSAIGSAGSYLFGSTLASSSAPLAIDGIGTVAASATFETAGVTGMSGGLMSGLTSALSAIPVWGWIALAVIAAIGYFMGQGGGPKWGGSAGGSFGPNGQYLGASGATGTENGRLYTPNGADADMQKVVDAAGQGFFKALAGLHGTSAGIGVSFGYDTDPSGSAGTRLSDQVRDSQGNILYENINQSVDKDKMPDAIALELERGILAGLQHSDFENATMKAILNSVLPKDATTDQIDTVIKLATAYQQLGDAINAVTASGPEKIAKTIKDLNDAVDTAGQNMDLALGTGDNAKILDAEQTLFAAVMNRYNTELQMVEQLRQNIRSVEEASYQFAISIAGKINSVGGSRDIGGIALGRANDLKGNIGGSEPIDLQVQDINSYVGAIDTWYQSRAAQIQADAERQAAAENAASQAGAAAAQAQVAALQQQLDLAMKWKDVLDKAGQMIDDMKLSSTNPLGIEGRTTLAQGDVQTLLASYQGATGQGKIDLAGQLMDALKTYSSLGQQAFDRPSDNWQAIYNEIQRDLTAIQGDAKDPAEQAVSLQQQILAAQQEANGWASATANASDIAATGMASLNEEALGYYTWAEENGTKLYDQQRQTYIDQLNAITGGVNVDLFIADLNKQMLEALKSIDARMAAAFPGTSATTGGTDTGGGPTGGGGDGSDVVTQKRGTTIVINTTASDPVQAVLANATRIKRALENA